MRMQLPGGLSAKKFLSQYWQKKPLLIRNAMPHFKGVAQAPELFALASRDDVESRLVQRNGSRWKLSHGPFQPADFRRLPAHNWTLLVQGLNLELDAADDLLRRFRFASQARLDDLMVSYATPGGGVGPHTDSYDVFLLQGPGRRRWSIAPPRDYALDPRVPMKVLLGFEPTDEWLLEPGDMLYLPPGWAHDGVALETCFTYSIGFRSPGDDEIASEFFNFLQERICLEGRYSDPGVRPARHAAEIPARMLRHAEQTIRKVRWNSRDVAVSLGRYLSEPKPMVSFSRPRRALKPADFAERVRARGVRLDRRTLMLFKGRDFFINGDTLAPPAALRSSLAQLADERSLPPGRRSVALSRLLYSWYLFGWMHIAPRHG